MSTTSAKLGLTLPDTNDNVDVAQHVSGNFQIIDDAYTDPSGFAPKATPSVTDLTATASAVDKVAATVKGFTGQTANLFEVQDSTSAVKVKITKDGDLAVGTERVVTEEIYTYALSSDLAVAVGTSRIYFDNDCEVVSFKGSVDTAPVGADIIFDMNKNATTIFTTQANRPKIVDGANKITWTPPDVVAFAAGDYLTIDVDQIGSGTKGKNFVGVLRVRRVV